MQAQVCIDIYDEISIGGAYSHSRYLLKKRTERVSNRVQVKHKKCIKLEVNPHELT